MSAGTANTSASPLPHYVSNEPFDPQGTEALTAEQERFYLASQWQLMLWKLKRHKVAVVAGIILAIMYASTLVSEVLAPYHLHTRHTRLHLRAAAAGAPVPRGPASSDRSPTASCNRSTWRR